MKKTILYDHHVKHGGKIVEFGGFLLPIEYTSLAEEHQQVRNHVGIFDVSHMGEIRVKGKDASKFLDYVMTNAFQQAPSHKMIYTFMLYEDGGIVDDLMGYKYSDEEYLLVVNASNTEKDYAHLLSFKQDYEVEIINESDLWGQIALQGPHAGNILQNMTAYPLDTMKLFEFSHLVIGGATYLVSRSGYTGSDGFEVYGKPNDIITLFEAFAEQGLPLCGLGCRDTLRFEAAMPLYGHEISASITPLEAGMGFAVKQEIAFYGSRALAKQKEMGIPRKLVGLELLGKGIARAEYEVEADGKVIGFVTTGYRLPNSEVSLAMALIDQNYAQLGSIVQIRIRKNLVEAKVRNKKFLDKKYYK